MSDSTEKAIPLNVRLAADGGATCLNPKTVADTFYTPRYTSIMPVKASKSGLSHELCSSLPHTSLTPIGRAELTGFNRANRIGSRKAVHALEEERP